MGKISTAILGAGFLVSSLINPAYAEEHFHVYPVNLKKPVLENGETKYKEIELDLFPVDKHIAIMKITHYRDDVFDESGNKFYFYMTDMKAGLKAYITKKELSPIENTDKYKEFLDFVKKNIKQDGGVERIIYKLENDKGWP